MGIVSAADEPADAAAADPVRPIEQRVRDLLEADDVRTAREVTEEALRTSPNKPGLLWLLADVEFADNNQQEGVCCLAKAVDASGGDAEAVSRQIRALSEQRHWHEALITIEHLPARAGDNPAVRTAVAARFSTRPASSGHAT
jgi:hypothetical protein